MNLKEDLQLECNIKVATRLKQLRLEHSFSIKELSQRTGISPYNLSKIEKCLRLIEMYEVILIAFAYDLDWLEFIKELCKFYTDEFGKKAILQKESNHPNRS